MSVKNSTELDGSDTKPSIDSNLARDQLASDTVPLGVDGTDSIHHFSRIRQEIIVEAPDGTIERRVDIKDRRLSAWIAYVDDRRTWRILNYRESFTDILKEALK